MRPARIAVAAALLALAIGVYQLSLPHVLTGELGYNTGYDDGVYVGAAIRFVHGAAPYRDFVIVHPPGIVYLLSPLALVGRWLGERDVLALARILTVLAVAANAGLAAWVVRARGRLAAAAAGLVMAAWPLTVAVDRTVELEPFLVLFCLLGAVWLFDGPALSAGRRLVWSGAWFGVALTVKVWAVLPLVAAVLVIGAWRPAGRFLAGAAGSAAVVCLPFFALAPGAFVRDVVLAQLQRDELVPSTSVAERLRLLTGVEALPGGGPTLLAVVLAAVLVAAVLWAYGLRAARRTRLDWFVLATYAVTVGGMFVSPTFYDHYAYFPAAFLALLVGVLVAAAAQVALPRLPSQQVRRGAAAAMLALVVAATVAQVRYARHYLAVASDPGPAIAAVIPPGACALSDFPTDLILANRYVARDAACPTVVDPYGLYLVYDRGRSPHLEPPAYAPDFPARWQGWLDRADYVDLRIPYSSFVPFTPDLVADFSARYVLDAHFTVYYDHPFLDGQKDEYLYRRTG